MSIFHILLLCLWFCLASTASAQELEPRRWTHVPVDADFFGLAYVHTEGDIFLDPVLRIEQGTVAVDSLVTSYLRSFDWLGKTARFDVRVPLQHAHWKGLLNGEPAAVDRNGLADPRFRLSFNFLGAPAMKGKDFQAYRAAHTTSTIAGAALAVSIPLGQYYEDKLLNLGENRFVIRPQMGFVHSRGPWSFELTGSVLFFTENDDFWNGNKREQAPLFTAQGHVVHTFKRGMWGSISAGYDRGGRSTVNDVEKDDRREDFLFAFSLGAPVTRTSSIKLAYAQGRTRQDVGSDADNIAVVYSGKF